MQDDPRLAEVRARLEEAVAALPGEATDPQEIFDRCEMVAIQMLDSEHADFCPGMLESYLRECLAAKRRDLGINEP